MSNIKKNIKMVILRPKINSKYHFGEGSLERSGYIFHSNSIFSAIVNNYIKLYGKKDFEQHCEKIKNIRLSSLFYKIKDIYLIPKPEHPKFYKVDESSGVKPKEVKKIQFLSIKAYNDILGINSDDNKSDNNKLDWKNNIKDILNYQTINKKIVISKDEIDEIKKIFKVDKTTLKNAEIKLVSRNIEQKVAIDRIKNTSLESDGRGQLYSVEFITLNKNVEFYFLIDYNTDDDSLIKKLDASIRLIEDEGLGGKRSIGAGFFEKVEIKDLPKDFKNIFDKSSDYYMLLGVGIPNTEEKDIDNNIQYYKLMEVGGYIYSPECLTKPKGNVLVLTEGSIVKGNFVGNVVDITPENININHKVYAHGKPILLPFFEG